MALDTIGGPSGSDACSSSRIHCTRTGFAGARQQDRFGGDIVGAIMAVAARALDMDAVNQRLDDANQLRQHLAQGKYALAMSPDRVVAVHQMGERA
jgi:hypothetical protein